MLRLLLFFIRHGFPSSWQVIYIVNTGAGGDQAGVDSSKKDQHYCSRFSDSLLATISLKVYILPCEPEGAIDRRHRRRIIPALVNHRQGLRTFSDTVDPYTGAVLQK